MVDLQRLRPGLPAADFRARHGLQECQVVACIGSFATQYDFTTLLAAARQLEGRSDLRFLFIGAGSQRDSLLDSGPNVQHIGWLPATEIPAAWAAADVSCYALRDHELYRGTLPARLYESMASGTPVVAAGSGEAARIIKESDAGIYVAAGAVDEFAAAIVSLLNDEALRARCARAGRAWAEAHCDAEVISRNYEQILSAAARKGNTA